MSKGFEIQSKFDSRCRNCGGGIRVGDRFFYSKGHKGGAALCVHCGKIYDIVDEILGEPDKFFTSVIETLKTMQNMVIEVTEDRKTQVEQPAFLSLLCGDPETLGSTSATPPRYCRRRPHTEEE